MKICWDNIEGFKLSKNGNFYKGTQMYIYMDSCVVCGDSYLTRKAKPSNFCSLSCSQAGKFNTMYRVPCPNTGKSLSMETRRKISQANSGKCRPEESKKRQSVLMLGKNNPQWKGGVKVKDLPLCDTYVNQINFAEDIRPYVNKDNLKLIELRCAYCGKWFIPRTKTLKSRIDVLNGKGAGESRLYCSVGCKNNCPVFGRQLYPKGFKLGTSREVDPYIRKLCFERDSWECQKCYSKSDLQCHHIKSYNLHKIIANDIDNCITLCKSCHKETHTKSNCTYNDQKCRR